MNNLGLRWKILIPLILIIIATLIEIWLIVSLNRAQQVSADQVNIAGRQRMLSQRMAKDVFGAAFIDPQYRADLGKNIQTFDSALNVLRDGGAVRVSGSEVTVRKTDDRAIGTQLQAAAADWHTLRPLVEQVADGQSNFSPRQLKGIDNQLTALMGRFDRITGMYQNASADKVRRGMLVIYAFLAGYFALAALMWYITNRYILKPITALKESAHEIARGNLASDTGI